MPRNPSVSSAWDRVPASDRKRESANGPRLHAAAHLALCSVG